MTRGKHVASSAGRGARAGVFVDTSGRRARWTQHALRIAVVCVIAVVVLIVISLVTGVPLPGLGHRATPPRDEQARGADVPMTVGGHTTHAHAIRDRGHGVVSRSAPTSSTAGTPAGHGPSTLPGAPRATPQSTPSAPSSTTQTTNPTTAASTHPGNGRRSGHPRSTHTRTVGNTPTPGPKSSHPARPKSTHPKSPHPTKPGQQS